MKNNDNIIVIQDLYKYFKDVKALDGVSLEVGRGKVIVVIGPSGSGKSTMLRCLNHLEKPTSGEIWIDGEQITGEGAQLNRVRAEIGMVFQRDSVGAMPSTLFPQVWSSTGSFRSAAKAQTGSYRSDSWGMPAERCSLMPVMPASIHRRISGRPVSSVAG